MIRLNVFISVSSENRAKYLEIAKEIATVQTVFTTHTPVPAGNDIFPIHLVEKYFKDYWDKLGISKQDFFQMGRSS